MARLHPKMSKRTEGAILFEACKTTRGIPAMYEGGALQAMVA